MIRAVYVEQTVSGSEKRLLFDRKIMYEKFDCFFYPTDLGSKLPRHALMLFISSLVDVTKDMTV